MKTVGFERHDHDTCQALTVRAVEAHCKREGLQLTPVRKRVLELLIEDHRAFGAYEVLGRLQEEGLGSHAPAAYRALDFLVAQGFAHRIERLNAFIACSHPAEQHAPAFLICRACKSVVETPGVELGSKLEAQADTVGFRIEHAAIEAEGICPNCASEDA
ncbi:MAG: Fur family transcriptional regulator [Pseudomonadota bacterium]